METASVSNVEETANQGPGPGGKLQAARVQLGLSIGDVADRMHLSNAILEALEENNFDEITAPIFVKGYLRAYARILSIDEESIISEYIEVYSNEDPPITSTSNTANEISSSDRRVKWMTYLVILVLIALIATWWWSEQQNGQQLISLDAEQTSAPAAVVDEGNPVEPPSEAEVSDGVEPQPAEVAAEETSDSAAEPASEEPLPLMSLQPEPEATAEESPTGDQTSGDAEPAVESEPAPAVVTTVAASSTSTSASLAQRQAPAGDDQFRLVVNADTWADIKDATGFQLVYDLMRADNTLVMTGTAPFEVFLGNGHGVDVEINGVPLDITTFIRDDNTARFQTDG